MNIYHGIATALDPRVEEPVDEEDRRKIAEMIEYLYQRLTDSGSDSESTQENEKASKVDEYGNNYRLLQNCKRMIIVILLYCARQVEFCYSA